MTVKARSILEKVGKLGGGLIGAGIGAGLGASAGLLSNKQSGDSSPLPVLGGALAGGALGAVGGHFLSSMGAKGVAGAATKATKRATKAAPVVAKTPTIGKADQALNRVITARQNTGARTMLSPNQATGKMERATISGPAGKVEQVNNVNVLRPYDRQALVQKFQAEGRASMKAGKNIKGVQQKYRDMSAAESTNNTHEVNRLLTQ